VSDTDWKERNAAAAARNAAARDAGTATVAERRARVAAARARSTAASACESCRVLDAAGPCRVHETAASEYEARFRGYSSERLAEMLRTAARGGVRPGGYRAALLVVAAERLEGDA
jgi:3-deoxy-D-arabino-heptulosonate 7-phosphate (DAHP) synthase